MTPSCGIGRLALLLSTAVIAQTAGPQLEFEVASIKPTDPMGRGQFQIHPGGTLDFRAVSLRLMILWAYDIRDFQLSGGPAWTASDRYDVMAKTTRNSLEAETASKTTATEEGTSVTDPIRLRLQALLADRFHLKLHREVKPFSAYALVVGKNGSKLKENDAPARGWMQWRTAGRLKGTHVDMRFLCVHLSRQVDRTVIDETGLTGSYDFELNWIPDSRPARPPSAPDAQTPALRDGESAPAPPDGPSIFTAIQEQLGLKLEPKKGLVAFFTIEQAEKPSDN